MIFLRNICAFMRQTLEVTLMYVTDGASLSELAAFQNFSESYFFTSY